MQGVCQVSYSTGKGTGKQYIISVYAARNAGGAVGVHGNIQPYILRQARPGGSRRTSGELIGKGREIEFLG